MKFIFSCLLTVLFIGARAQSDSLTEYTGTYRFPDGSPTPEVEISVQDGSLYASSTIGSAAMVRKSKDTFNIPTYYNALVYFVRNNDGKVNRIHVEAEDTVLDGDKQAPPFARIQQRQLYLAKLR